MDYSHIYSEYSFIDLNSTNKNYEKVKNIYNEFHDPDSDDIICVINILNAINKRIEKHRDQLVLDYDQYKQIYLLHLRVTFLNDKLSMAFEDINQKYYDKIISAFEVVENTEFAFLRDFFHCELNQRNTKKERLNYIKFHIPKTFRIAHFDQTYNDYIEFLNNDHKFDGDNICWICKQLCTKNSSISDRYFMVRGYFYKKQCCNNIYMCDKCHCSYKNYDFDYPDYFQFKDDIFICDHLIRMND